MNEKGSGERRDAPSPSLGLQGEAQLDTGEFLPLVADHHPHAVVAVGHPGGQLDFGQGEVAGGQ